MQFSNSMTHRRMVRLFPLDDVVLFPRARLPLRIFEPRYLHMVEDALSSNREITLILPQLDDSGDPAAIHAVGTLGRIENVRRTPGGEIRLDLIGTARVRIMEEVPNDKLYREARVEVLRSYLETEQSTSRELARSEILRHLKTLVPDNETASRFLFHLAHQCDLKEFTDLVSYSAPLPVELKQHLLEECCVDRRLDLLVETAHEALDLPARLQTTPLACRN